MIENLHIYIFNSSLRFPQVFTNSKLSL